MNWFLCFSCLTWIALERNILKNCLFKALTKTTQPQFNPTKMQVYKTGSKTCLNIFTLLSIPGNYFHILYKYLHMYKIQVWHCIYVQCQCTCRSLELGVVDEYVVSQAFMQILQLSVICCDVILSATQTHRKNPLLLRSLQWQLHKGTSALHLLTTAWSIVVAVPIAKV